MESHRHRRRSIRLKGYDYSQSGVYFVTICCQDRANLFGTIQNGVMLLNDAGKMVEKWYWELSNKYPDIQCGEMVVMPDHIHFIIINVNVNVNINVGADLRVCPNGYSDEHLDENDEHLGENLDEHAGSPLHDEHLDENAQYPTVVCMHKIL